MAKKSVKAKETQGDVVPSAIAARMFEAANERKGFEGMGSGDYAIPFLKILDKSSSSCIKASDDYVDGAEPGMILDTVTKRLFPSDEGVLVIPCGFRSVTLEFESAEPNSGFCGEHPASSDIKAEAQLNDNGKMILPNGHCLVDANNHYILQVDVDGGLGETKIISMQGSQLKTSRRWNSMMAGRKVELEDGTRFVPPTFGVIYQLITSPQSKDQYHWHGWEIFDHGLVETEALLEQAEDFAETIVAGFTGLAAPQAKLAGPVEEEDNTIV